MRPFVPLFALVLFAACTSDNSIVPVRAVSAHMTSQRPFTRLDGELLSAAQIDATVERLMTANRVRGLALALIGDGEVAYVQTYGYRDLKRRLPLQRHTILYAASLTKATFAYFVMQLVDEGRIDLDRSIESYLSRPLPDYKEFRDLAGDPRWRALTPRILLNHTSGFANLRRLEEDGNLRIHWQPGSRYAYSGEGIALLQFVLEKGLGLDVGAEMGRRIFDRFGMTRTSMTWRDDFAANVAHGYALDGSMERHDRRDTVNASGSMDTTIEDWSRFLVAVLRGEGLKPASRAELIRRQVEIQSVTQFPTLRPETTDANRVIKLGYALGWGVFQTPYGHAFFKEGHDDWTANYALCVEPRTCILLMSNSVRAEGIFKYLVDALLGETGLPWAWEGYIPYDVTR
jgi:CubicO group peptidase (beta-lactamase class C family)